MTKEAMKLALEALELTDAPLNNETVVLWEQKIDEAITALRKALAEQPAQQQPVAWGYIDEYGEVQKFENPSAHKRDAYSSFQLLYTSPPTLSLAQRQARSADTWVGLTDEDKAEIKKQANYNWETTTGEYASKVQALTEAKLKEKNNGN